MAVEVSLPRLPQSPLFSDIKNQTISKEWIDFFYRLWIRSGGASSTIPDVSGIVALRIVATDADEELGSVNDLTDWIAGTSNQITSTSDGDGTLTLSVPALLSITSLLLGGYLRLSENSPAQITANQNNYDPGNYIVLRISTDASRNITGFDGGLQGRVLIIFNVGSQNVVLKNQDASSDADNRIATNTGADITISANEMAFLYYDSTTSRWRATEL